MAKGDGSIREVKTKDGKSYRPKKWRVCVSFGFDPITKKREQVVRIVTGTKADAQKKRDEIRREREFGISADAYKLTFAEFAESWAKARKNLGELQERTLEGDRRYIGLMLPYIGELKLQEITPAIVENMYTEIKKSKPGRKGSGLSGTTMHSVHQKLSQILNDAEYKGLISRNPCNRVKAPKTDKPDRKSLSREEFSRFAQYTTAQYRKTLSEFINKEKRQMQRGNECSRSMVRGLSVLSRFIAVFVGISTGMRIGEILGLVWACVDLKKGKIEVCQALTNNGNIKKPKNEHSRTISIDDATVLLLSEWQKVQAYTLNCLGTHATGKTPVCCSDSGGFYGIANFEHWFRHFRVDADFPNLRFHELRHTQATQLIANGVDIKTVQERLGHTNASTTLNFYAHATEESDKEAANLIGSIIKREAPIIEFKTA